MLRDHPVGSSAVTTRFFKLRCHSRAPRGNPPVGSAGVTTRFFKLCCHSRAPRGNPLVGSAAVTTTHRPCVGDSTGFAH